MPVKDSIELGNGCLYFNGVSDPVEVENANVISSEEEYADDVEYITGSIRNAASFTFECDNVEINRNWTLVRCEHCGQQFPVTYFYALLLGTKNWTCPLCQYIKIVEGKRDEQKH